jgi:iron-sulfur cluster assembly protein
MTDTIIIDEVGKERIPTGIVGAKSDDDIFISHKALEMITEIRKENNVPEDYFLRIATRGGGCSGMNYTLGFDNEFDEQNDRKYQTDKILLVVDAKSLFYLMGVTLDFVEGPDGSGFVFNNPNNAHTCGCHG